MLIRDAQQRVRDGAAFPDVKPDVDRALRWLSGALSLGETGERLALLGSYHKRCATMTQHNERSGHLEEALDHYARAEQLKDNAYYWNNWQQLYHVAGLLGSGDLERWRPPDTRPRPPAAAAASDKSAPPAAGATDIAWAADPPPEAETFWDRARTGDDLLTSGIVSGQLDGTALVDAYDDAFRLRSSERERASVVDHLHDLADLLPADHPLGPPLKDAFARLSGWKP
jgi:hypothetical protein